MKDRLKIYLFIVSFLFIAIHITSEYLAKKVDEEVEIYKHHTSILFNTHELIYHITAIQEEVYSLEYGTFEDAKPIKAHVKHLEKAIEGLSNGIRSVFIAGRDDNSFREFSVNAETVQNLYPNFKAHLNGIMSAKDVRERRMQLEEVIEIGERMEFFIRELDKHMEVQHTTVSSFFPTVTAKMRWIRNIGGVLLWGIIVILSILYFYSCKPYIRLLPYLKAVRSGRYDYKPRLRNTLCEQEVESTIKEVMEKVHDSEKYSSDLSIVDPLTGAYNRRYFDMRITEEMSKYTRHGTIFSLSIIDIDYFKKINDTFGHQTGDSVLKEMVTVIRSCLRDTDIVTRYGGEEFSILSPYTPKSGVLTMVERLRASVEGHEFTGLDHPLTISIGVADSAGKNTLEHIIEEADSNLYIAKNSGRNRCEVGGVGS